MAGLGLVNALEQYQQGVSFRQDQEERAIQKQRRDNLMAADKAAADVIEGSKAEWALNGAHGTYTPNDTTMFKAAEARGQALAKAGDWENFLKNEAAVQGQRMRVRHGALQRYKRNGDIEALARDAYPSVFDGKQIVSSEKIEGADAVAGLPARPSRVKFKLSDGSDPSFTPLEIVAMIEESLIDPQKAAEQEIALNFARAKNDIETKGKITVEQAKGEEARRTEGVKGKNAVNLEGVRHTNAVGLEGVKADYSLGLAKVNNEAAQQRAKTSAGATLGAARIGADNRLAVAALDNASRERVAEKAGKGEGKRLNTTQRLRMVEDSFGELNQGGFGANRVGSATTAKIVQGMEAYLKQFPDASESEAMNAAAEKMGIKAPPVERK